MFDTLTSAEREQLSVRMNNAAIRFNREFTELVPGRDYSHYPAWPHAGRVAWEDCRMETRLIWLELGEFITALDCSRYFS